MTRLDRPQIIVHAARSLVHTPRLVRWLPDGRPQLLLLGETSRGTGIIQLYELRAGSIELVCEQETAVPLKCASFGAAPSASRLLTAGGFDGSLTVWDIGAGCIKGPVGRVDKAHSAAINAMDACAGNTDIYGPPEIATGGRDGYMRIWDARQLATPVLVVSPVAGETARDCWAVAIGNSFNNDERHVCAGYENGDMKIFDLRTSNLHWEANLRNGVCCIDYDRWDISANKLAVGTLEANIFLYDMRTRHPERGYAYLQQKAAAEQNCTVWGIRHLPQNREVMAVLSGGGTLAVHKYNYPTSRVKRGGGHSDEPEGVAGTLELLNTSKIAEQPVSSFDWSAVKLGLFAFVAFDQTLRVAVVTRLSTI